MSWSETTPSIFTRPETSAVPAQQGLVSVEQQRAIAEVQARMIIARSNPRDYMRVLDAIKRDCTRPALAQSAFYQYARSGSSISGPSIRLAEAIARKYGNLSSGIKEISRDEGYSECVAYAWDLETGYYDERQFQVRHWVDTKTGGRALTDERDIYEMIANLGQRRKRACLLTVIDGDIIEAATDQCEETLRTTADTSPEALKKMVEAFGTFNVTREDIEIRCQCRLEAIRPAQVIQMRKIFNSLKDGMSSPSDWFKPNPVAKLLNEQRRREGDQAQRRAEAPVVPSKEQQELEAKLAGAKTGKEQQSGGTSEQTIGKIDTNVGGTFEAYLVDHTGEPVENIDDQTGEITQMILRNPVDFANWLASVLHTSANPDALWENNADSRKEAMASPEAAIVLEQAEKHLYEQGDARARIAAEQRERFAAEEAEKKKATEQKSAPADKDLTFATKTFIPEVDGVKTTDQFNGLMANKIFRDFAERMMKDSPTVIYPLLKLSMDECRKRLGLPPLKAE